MATNNELIKILNHLIEIGKDGANGYATAAGAVKTPELKQLFTSYAHQRALFATELQAEVQRLGGTPEQAGTVAATLHRGWMNLKSLVTGHDEAALIAECDRSEAVAVKAYEEALKAPLPAEVKSVVQRQFEQVQEAHARIRALETVASKS
jgi:uncharacterized protein (TIGR02284 family)